MTRKRLVAALGVPLMLLLGGCGQLHVPSAPETRGAPALTATAITTAATAAAVPQTSASPDGVCHAVALEIAAGVTGSRTPDAAITAFIKSGTATFALPATGWSGPDSVDRYTSGAASVVVMHLPGAGYVVTEATAC